MQRTAAVARGYGRCIRPRWPRQFSTLPQGALQEIFRPGRVHDVVNPRLVETSWVSDPSRLLPDSDRSEVDELCEKLQREWKAEAVVVVLDSLAADVQPTGFAAALLNFWGVGDQRLHTGLLILLLTGQRRLEMRTGYGLARILPSEVLQSLQQSMVPQLAAGSPGRALCQGLKGALQKLEEDAPKHWRNQEGASSDRQRNSHGFGGGQTPVDEFMPKDRVAPK
ncbi:unnamed protein product [Symbiodinium necroappetens]|uniref:TPM domain-containing protein n=1 Tax=Symbiodinium necroappetens TaxID=1628268 RepID=A0A813B1S7_9DINO|nr:unnamed protein product [Symbiodinium necroappetens]